jgi:copper chaperone
MLSDDDRAWEAYAVSVYSLGVYDPMRGRDPEGGGSMAETVQFHVPDMSCAHCERAVTEELASVPGVASVHVDLTTKLVRVDGEDLDDRALRAAIDTAGYEAT